MPLCNFYIKHGQSRKISDTDLILSQVTLRDNSFFHQNQSERPLGSIKCVKLCFDLKLSNVTMRTTHMICFLSIINDFMSNAKQSETQIMWGTLTEAKKTWGLQQKPWSTARINWIGYTNWLKRHIPKAFVKQVCAFLYKVMPLFIRPYGPSVVDVAYHVFPFTWPSYLWA